MQNALQQAAPRHKNKHFVFYLQFYEIFLAFMTRIS